MRCRIPPYKHAGSGCRILVPGMQLGCITSDLVFNLARVARPRQLWWFAPLGYTQLNTRRKESDPTATAVNRMIFCVRNLSNGLSLLFSGILVRCGVGGHFHLTQEVSAMMISSRKHLRLRWQTYVLYNGTRWTRNRGGRIRNLLRPYHLPT